jgi:thiamine pyrophosphokinase
VIIGALGGRFDQEMACIQALVSWKESFLSLSLVTKDNIIVLLKGCERLRSCASAVVDETVARLARSDNDRTCDDAGTLHALQMHKIPCVSTMGRSCGLLPIVGPVSNIWTQGLKWNLHGDGLKFGGLISTSNSMLKREDSSNDSWSDVFVATTDDVIWTCEYRPTLGCILSDA